MYMVEPPCGRQPEFPLPVWPAPPKIVGMSVIAAALCEEGKSGVVAADTMASFGQNVQVEAGCSKIAPLCGRLLVGGAGKKQQVDRIIQALRSAEAELEPLEMSGVMARMALECGALREDLCRQLGGMLDGLLRFLGKAPDPKAVLLNPQTNVLNLLSSTVGACTLNAVFLALGRDPSGQMHLVTLEEQLVQPEDHDEVGFTAVGSGAMYAMVALDAHFPRANASLAAAVYGVYCAKKAAELAPHVGRKTDIAVLKDGAGIVFLDEDDAEALESIRQSQRPADLSAKDLVAVERRLQDRMTRKSS